MSAPGGGLSSPKVPLRLPGAWRLVVGREDGREPWETLGTLGSRGKTRTAKDSQGTRGGGAKQPPEGSSTLNHFKTRSPLRSGQASGYESRKAQQARSTRAQSTSWNLRPPSNEPFDTILPWPSNLLTTGPHPTKYLSTLPPRRSQHPSAIRLPV